MKKIKFIDLFAGIGGFRLALENKGGMCVFSSEWDKHAKKTYFENFNETPFDDIQKIDEKDIPSHDVLCGGFPCQAFSISGKQKGFEDIRGTLFFDIIRIATYHKPKVLFLENVSNILGHDSGNTLNVILEKLSQANYDVFYKIINSSEFGVPQSRKRAYFICFRKDLKISDFKFPEPKPFHLYVKDILESSVSENYFINREDIKINKFFSDISNEPIRIGTINKGGQGERVYSIFGKGITLSAYGGGIAGKTGAYFVNNRVRRLTPRECARLQGFPDSFVIPVSNSQAYKQFGNSVSLPVIESIFESICKIPNLFEVEKTHIDNSATSLIKKEKSKECNFTLKEEY